jgi:hypothetical protein
MEEDKPVIISYDKCKEMVSSLINDWLMEDRRAL